MLVRSLCFLLILSLGGAISARGWSQDAPEKKPEDKKVEEKKPEEKKPEEKKPEETKPEDKKPEDKKPEDKKPEDKKPEDKKPEDKKPGGPKAQAWEKELTSWKDRLKKLRELQTKYSIAEPAEAEKIREDYSKVVEEGRKALPALRTAGVEAYTESPNEDRELAKFLVKLAADDIRQDLYDDATPLLKLLQEKNCTEKGIANMAGIVGFVNMDLDNAEKNLKAAEADGSISDQGRKFLADIPEYKKHWAKESELRKKEEEAKDNPRVKIETTAGNITIELFENEAPETVGNFVSLVEAKKYDGLIFHRVLPGFMAQGGDPAGDGTGGPGYKIYCECYGPNARMHFRGSLSMAHAGRDTGGSQFFLTFVPTGHLNGRHTVFGRVVEGMDVLAKIKRRDPDPAKPDAPADKIVKAEVVRKRDHKYVPHKVEGSGTEEPAPPKKEEKKEEKKDDKKTEEKKTEEKKTEEKKIEEKK